MFDGSFLCGGWHRLVIQAGAVQPEQVGLQDERQVTVLMFDHCQPLISRQRRGQIF
jgi:hypothetical protein